MNKKHYLHPKVDIENVGPSGLCSVSPGQNEGVVIIPWNTQPYEETNYKIYE